MGVDWLYRNMLARLTAAWQGLPDKPDETPDYTLRTLWSFVGSSPGKSG